MKKTTVTGLEEKWEVLLVYFVSLLGFIFSFLKYDYLSENIKFHYRQAGTIVFTLPTKYKPYETNILKAIKKYISASEVPVILFEDTI